MKVIFEVTGLSCDLALHPISAQTAEEFKMQGREIYGQKYINWWRRGTTRTFGMRLNDSPLISLLVDDELVDFDKSLLYHDVYSLHSRMYLESKAHYLAIMGYDNETCTFRRIWNNIQNFDPKLFTFSVTDWDNVLNTKGYRVLDDMKYNGKHCDKDEWLDPSGFTLLDPIIIDLEAVRKQLES